jgi:hypothetical protein
MIDWIITYEILAGFFFRVWNHNCLVLRGAAFPWYAIRHHSGTVRVVAYGFLALLASKLHTATSGSYCLWWREYRCGHTLGFWFLAGLAPALVLYLLATITYVTAKDPHAYRLYPDGASEPTFLRTSIKTTFTWFLAFWAWVLLTPTLPFRTCYVQAFLFRQKPEAVQAGPCRLKGPIRPAVTFN